jgi:uncharacterized protein YbaR (Trm112 family)
MRNENARSGLVGQYRLREQVATSQVQERRGVPCLSCLTLSNFGLNSEQRKNMAVSPELLEILRCPKCKSTVEPKADGSSLKCTNPECALVYPIRDDIPVMLVEEATVEK